MTARSEVQGNLGELPKAHLHLHLVGSMRPETMVGLHAEAGIEVELAANFDDFGHFNDTYALANSAIRSADDLGRLVLEVLEDAKADGAVWVEPTLYLDSFKDVIGPGELILEIATDALKSAREHLGIGAKLIVPAQRNLGPVDAVRQAQLAIRGDPDVIAGFGLVNFETDYPIEDFGEAIEIVSGAGLAFIPHAGEFLGPDQVALALEFGAARIAHGISAARDAALMAKLADRGVCLDVCPTSNVAVGQVESLADHPLPILLAAGVPISLGADDSLLFSCSLLSEYELARSAFAFTDVQLATIAEASIRHSIAPDHVKTSAVADVRAWLTA
jgi:adenosine deaminase